MKHLIKEKTEHWKSKFDDSHLDADSKKTIKRLEKIFGSKMKVIMFRIHKDSGDATAMISHTVLSTKITADQMKKLIAMGVKWIDPKRETYVVAIRR